MPEKSRRARLFSRTGETRGVEFEIAEGATIGRNPENSIVLEPSLISSRHARIGYDDDEGRFELEDLGSLNGTELDGHRVRGRERLGHLHVITFAGKHDFIFQDPELCAGRRRETPAVAAVTPARRSPPPPAEGAPREVTGVEDAPALMPSFLAEGAEEAPPREVTGVESVPALMPSFLADKGGPAEPATPVTSGEPDPSDRPEARDEDLDGRTKIEKLAVAIPDVLAARDKDSDRPPDGKAGSQPVETLELEDVDLPSASELLADDDGPPREVLELMAGGPARVTYGLEFAAAAGGFQNVELVDGENVLGRGVDARIKPDSLDISRRHAAITVSEGRVTVRDLGSRNHTYVKGEQIDGEVEIEVGTRLRFGGVEARLIALGGDEQ